MNNKPISKLTKICLHCGTLFESWPSQDRKFCSTACGHHGKSAHLVQRFLDKVHIKPSGCWEWSGSLRSDGYGEIRVTNNKHFRTHRLMWELVNGDIPKGKMVLHKCDNPACCDPNHLFLGDQQINMKDRDNKGRVPSGIQHYRHKLDFTKAKQIKVLHKQGLTLKQIGEKFGVCDSLICQVVNDKAWFEQAIFEVTL